VPVRGLHHVDLAVAGVERSVSFSLALLRPLGLRETARYPTYRGTDDVVDWALFVFRPGRLPARGRLLAEPVVRGRALTAT